MNDRTRAHLIMLAGLVIMVLGIGSALQPALHGLRGSASIGIFLCAAGIVEMIAGALRQEVKPYAVAAGGVTVLAGVMFLLNPTERFFPTVTPIIGWLVIRSAILAYASQHTRGSVRMWTGLSAGLDVLLALLLIAGLSIATLVVSVFGPTPPLIASFSWVLAASFVVTGSLLLEVANCERSAL